MHKQSVGTSCNTEIPRIHARYKHGSKKVTIYTDSQTTFDSIKIIRIHTSLRQNSTTDMEVGTS